MPGTAADLIAYETSQLGVSENPPNSNRVPYWDIIGLPDWQGEEWCACFQTAAMMESGVPFPSLDAGLAEGFVYCPDAYEWGLAHGDLITDLALVLPGDLVLFDWGNDGVADHVGLVEFVQAGVVHTIEGNTQLADGNGGVGRETHTDDMLAFIRPRFANTPGPRPEPVPIATPTMRGNMIDSNPAGPGTVVTSPNGSVYAYDFPPGEGFYGSLPGLKVTPAKPIVGICMTPTGKGYWLVGADGGVFCFGDAPDLGSLTLHENWDAGTEGNPCIGIARWKGNGTNAGGNGFELATRPTASTEPSLYQFPGDGRYAKA